ncbi:MAG: hypothetical protein RBR81_02860 [Bacteroidales bacterium]|jgi:uncharacterized membrane protein|nr:hypothetical protein [Bacteroidales bacterium]
MTNKAADTDLMKFSLPHFFRPAGIILAITGSVIGLLFMLIDLRISLPVFAIVSMYLEKKFLTVFTTNVADELILLCLLGGLFLIVFSREKPGTPSRFNLKARSLFAALFYNSLFLGFSILFLYGQAFGIILALNVFSIMILYLIFLYVFVRKDKYRLNEKPDSGNNQVTPPSNTNQTRH